jgi:hypothetical protein
MFAADRFFNLLAGTAVILRELVCGFAGLETFGHDVRAHARTNDNGAAKRNEGVDYDVFGLLDIADARERKLLLKHRKRASPVFVIDLQLRRAGQMRKTRQK